MLRETEEGRGCKVGFSSANLVYRAANRTLQGLPVSVQTTKVAGRGSFRP